MRLTSYFKNRIISLRDQNFSFSQVREKLLIEKCTTSLSAIKRFAAREKKGWFADKPRPGRSRKLLAYHDEFIDNQIKEDRKIKISRSHIII